MGTQARRASQQRTVLIVLAAVGVGLLAICLAGGAVAYMLVIRPVPKNLAKKVYEREELRNLLIGRTKEEVVMLLGNPDRTEDTGKNSIDADWTYYDVTFDKASGNKDSITSVNFRNGRVVKVHSF